MSRIIPQKIEKVLDFFQESEKLKSAIRFLERGGPIKESSADHSWRLALMVFVVAEELKLNINLEKSLKIALIHDLAESITGDIDYMLVAEGKISKKEKTELELNAMQKIKATLPKIGNEIFTLWNEFEKSSTREAIFVKALDRLETLSHLLNAGHKVYDKRPEIIPNYADEAVKKFPELIPMLILIKNRLKKEFKKGHISWKSKYDLVEL